jgi:hypothetical protein
LFTQPYCRVTDLVRHDVTSRNTASRYLRELAGDGVLEQRKEGREILYMNTRFLELLKKEKHDFAPYPPVEATTSSSRAAEAPASQRADQATQRRRTSS